MPESQIDVEHLFTLTAATGDATDGLIKGGPAGTRVIVPVTGGSFAGPNIKGSVVAPGGDWVSMRGRGVMKLDVRLLLVTDDGESILMTYQGIGKRDDDGVNHLRTAPTFETGSEKYGWLNEVQAIGIGTSSGSTVSYEVYAVS